MATLVEENENWILTLPKGEFPKDFLFRLLDVIQMEELARRNQMTDEQAWQISEDIKSSWWNANGPAILKKIEASKG